MKKIRIAVDLLMTAALLLLMSYNMAGEVVHEVIGVITFTLFVVHHILNRKWSKSIFKGRYTPIRIVQTILVALVCVSMLMQMISGVILSKHVFSFVDPDGLTSAARIIHILGAYWGFVLTSLHLGIHWNSIIAPVIRRGKKQSKVKQILFAAPSFIVAAYGLYAFVNRDIADYMFLRSQFVFFDFNEPLLLFILDYLAIMGFFVFLAYYLTKRIRSKSKK